MQSAAYESNPFAPSPSSATATAIATEVGHTPQKIPGKIGLEEEEKMELPQQDEQMPGDGYGAEKSDLQMQVDELIERGHPIHMIQFDTTTSK